MAIAPKSVINYLVCTLFNLQTLMAIAPKSVINYLVCTLFYLQPWVRKNQDFDGDSFKKCHKLFGLYIVLLAALGEKEPRL